VGATQQGARGHGALSHGARIVRDEDVFLNSEWR
jgi:hypothetical protein